MDLPTYTNIWRIEKRLYKLYDFRLPMPLPMATFGVALGIFALWVVLLSLLRAPFDFGNGWHLVLWVVPPGVITVLATRPVIEGKRLTELLLSHARYFAEARVYTRLAPEYEAGDARVFVRVWHRDPDAGPLPLTVRPHAGQEEVTARAEEVQLVEPEPERLTPEAAPPLPEVARPAARYGPEPAPVPEEGERKEGVAEPARVPVAVTAGTHGHEATAAHSEEPQRRAFAGSEAEAETGAAGADRRGVGRRMLNYFGFGLESGSAEPPDQPRGYGRAEWDDEEEADFGEPVYDTEEEEQRDRDEWFASLRAPSGETPVGLTSKGAYTGGDTGAMSSSELAEAAGTRRRAEEVMAAPEPAGERQRSEEQQKEESAPARRLRGRAQGVRVSRELAERRTDEEEQKRVGAAGQAREATEEQARGVEQAREPGEQAWEPGEQARARAPEAPRTRARGQGLPAAEPPRSPEQSSSSRPQERPRRGRPHAAPWELGSSGKEKKRSESSSSSSSGSGRADLSDYAARYAAATGRPDAAETNAVPWLPPGSETPPERRERAAERFWKDTDEKTADSGGAPAAGAAGEKEQQLSGAGPWRSADDTAGPAATADPAAVADTADPAAPAGAALAEPERAEPERAGSSSSVGGDAPAAESGLEMDHGTGEQSAMPFQPSAEPEDHGPEWNERMSVLDQHLTKADTPPPPRPKFADALSSNTRDGQAKDSAEWFEDGKKRHPDQPKIGDRGNPTIPARELREQDAEARETAEEGEKGTRGAGTASEAATEQEEQNEEQKPNTQLDHGTGELVSFTEVRDEPEEPAPRRTVADLEQAEAEALERRRKAARADARSGNHQKDARGAEAPSRSGAPEQEVWRSSAPTARDPRSTPSIADALNAERKERDRGRSAPPVPGGGTGQERARTEEKAGTGKAQSEKAQPGKTGPGKAEAERARAQKSGRPGAQHASQGQANQGQAGEEQDSSESLWSRSPGHGAPLRSDRLHQPHEQQERDDQEPKDDGVFHRVAQNARRLGHLFGQPVPGEEPDPPQREPKSELELDHGTGEQERLGDTPNGVPSHRPEPKEHRRQEASGDSGGTRGWRRLAKVVTGGAAPVRSDLPDSDIERLRAPLAGPRGLVVLGCTGGAGQTVTTLMLGHTLAAHRDDLVVAVDVNPGPNGLSRRLGAQSPETLTALLANADGVAEYDRMRDYTSQASTGLEVVQTLDDPYVQTLDDRDYGRLTGLLGGFYGITLLDPAATGVSRALPVADGLVLVAPASADAERAVSMTFEWLDGNGYGALRANSVLVINGVSKRSLGDVDAAERVARGRCRAIVRVPWDDHLGSSYTKIDVGALRPATKRAHGALGGVLVNAVSSGSTQ